MRNIQDLKEKKQEEFALKYFKKKFDELEEREARFCSYAAEARAYAEVVIPTQYNHFTIFDFTGRSSDLTSRLIPSAIAFKAKDSICKYCWDLSWKEIQKKGKTELQKRNFLRSHSVMKEKLEKGVNIAIFGDSSGFPIGRTMVASIIMSQAIKLRMSIGMKGQTYDSGEIVAELGGCILLTILGYDRGADKGGAFKYVTAWSKGKDPIAACRKMLERTCDAVALILSTAKDLQNPTEDAAEIEETETIIA